MYKEPIKFIFLKIGWNFLLFCTKKWEINVGKIGMKGKFFLKRLNVLLSSGWNKSILLKVASSSGNWKFEKKIKEKAKNQI